MAEPHSGDKFELVVDVLKELGKWLVVTLVAYLWWTTVLLILSLVLLSVWHIRLDDLLKLSGALTFVISAIYAVYLVRRWKGRPVPRFKRKKK
ncbi:MAG: hypothetical protein ACSW8F_02900 [bacterium]